MAERPNVCVFFLVLLYPDIYTVKACNLCTLFSWLYSNLYMARKFETARKWIPGCISERLSKKISILWRTTDCFFKNPWLWVEVSSVEWNLVAWSFRLCSTFLSLIQKILNIAIMPSFALQDLRKTWYCFTGCEKCWCSLYCSLLHSYCITWSHFVNRENRHIYCTNYIHKNCCMSVIFFL